MENKKISTNRQKKERIIFELSEKIQKAKSIVFTNYQGLTHKQLEDLKKALRALNAEFIVAKNTLLGLAFKNDNLKMIDDKSLEGPTGALFIYDDIIMPLKNLAKSLKDLGLPTIKFGILDNQALDPEQVLKLASLPPREVLIAQTIGGLKSPIYGLHRALNWNIQKLAMTLSAIQQKKV